MLNRKYRLSRSNEFTRVKKTGKSFSHPIIILIKAPNPELLNRIGISAGRTVGNAVLRNRAKRRMRASLEALLENLQPGWDLVFLARKPINEATHLQLVTAMSQLLNRAGLLVDNGLINERS